MKKLLACLILCPAFLLTQACGARGDFDEASEIAASLAASPWQPQDVQIPAALAALRYDDYRKIRFREDRALWRTGTPGFQVQLFHPGFFFKEPVQINEVIDGTVHRVPYLLDDFDFSDLGHPPGWDALPGHAGFKITWPLHSADKTDEIAAFLGASYYRMLARHLRYGLSARALAIDTGCGKPEEFPVFRRFWLHCPRPGEREMTVVALLDSPRAVGAWEFVIRPGTVTVTDVRARIWLRGPVEVLGLAPLTSMFWFGENTPLKPDDYRHEVHDSDGLLLAYRNGERLWRPLQNPHNPQKPSSVRTSIFSGAGLSGFGLLQRDRDFRDYDDTEAHYEMRPSVWVEPRGSWPAGELRLVEIPSGREFDDNIVAFFRPSELPPAGQPLEFACRQTWFGEAGPDSAGGGHVVSTRESLIPERPGERRIVVEFAGGQLDGLSEGAEVEGEVTIGPGAAPGHRMVQRVPQTGRWRLVFEFTPDPARDGPVEMRAFLRWKGDVLTETWTQPWNP